MTRQDKDDERLVQRVTALLLSIPGHQRNYTATVDMAKWLVAEARRVGWELRVDG